MFNKIVQSLFTKCTVALINFLILIISSRYLGVVSRGEISLFLLNILVIQVIAEIYTGYGLIYFMHQYNLKKIIVGGILFILIISSAGNGIVSFTNKQVPGFEWLGYFISILVLLNTFNCVLLLGSGSLLKYNILSFLQPLLLLIGLAIAVFVIKIYTFNAYVIPLLFSFIVSFIISISFLLTSPLKSDKEEFRLMPILSYGLLFQAVIIMHLVGNRYSYYWLPDNASIGIYSAATSFTEAVLVLTQSLIPVFLARVNREKNKSVTFDVALSLTKFSFLLTFIVLLILFFVPESLFTLILGEGFSGIKHLVLLYSPAVLCMSVYTVAGSFFSVTGNQKIVLAGYSAGFVINLVLTPLLINKYGITGAPVAAFISHLFNAFAICFAFFNLNNVSLRHIFTFSWKHMNLGSYPSEHGK
jgi:O-antigen/teichoic acid export membrane protein